MFWMCFLKIAGTDLACWNLRRDRQNRHAGAVSVEQSIDQMKVARPARPGANRQAPGQLGLGGRRESCGLFVAQVHERNMTIALHGIRDAVQTIAHHAIDALNLGIAQRCDNEIGDRLAAHVQSTSYLEIK